MAVAWLERLRADLSQRFNLRGEGPPQYLPISEGIQLTYSVADLLARDPASAEPEFGRSLVASNPQAFDATPAALDPVPTTVPSSNQARVKVGAASKEPGSAWWLQNSRSFPSFSGLGWVWESEPGLWCLQIDSTLQLNVVAFLAEVAIATVPITQVSTGGLADLENLAASRSLLGSSISSTDESDAETIHIRYSRILNVSEAKTLFVGLFFLTGVQLLTRSHLRGSLVRLTSQPVRFPLDSA